MTIHNVESGPTGLPGRPTVTDAQTYDVVVVGGGGTRLAAANEARATGCSVVLIEKNEKLGGSTVWSVGSISVSGSPHQQAKGIIDTPAEHYATWRCSMAR